MNEIGFTNIFIGILLILISIPLVLKKIKMNKFYGFRYKKSFQSDENWYKINAHGGKILIYWSFLIIFSGIIYEYNSCLKNYEHWFRVIPIIIIIIAMTQNAIYSKKV